MLRFYRATNLPSGLACLLGLFVSAMLGCSDVSGARGSGGTGGDPGTGGTPIGNGEICKAADPNNCMAGECQPVASRFSCTEQGIRDAIAAGGGPHGFECEGLTTVTTTAPIEIDNDVILDGEGNLTVDGDDNHRVFEIAEGVSAELHGFTVTRGQQFGNPKAIGFSSGAGIKNRGELLLANSTVSGNETGAWANGGGIANFGRMTITKSTVSGNVAVRVGGGIYNSGEMVLCHSTVSGNTAENRGGPTIGETGGILNGGGALTLVNSTVSGNAAVDVLGERGGNIGGIGNFAGGTLTLINSTLSGNTASEAVDGLYSSGGKLIAINSLVDGDCLINSTAEPPTEIVSNGYNIESPGNTCGFEQETDQVDINADELKLGQLQDNGGRTETHAVRPESVAINVIPGRRCGVYQDQRGVARPQGPTCDVGAFEAEE